MSGPPTRLGPLPVPGATAWVEGATGVRLVPGGGAPGGEGGPHASSGPAGLAGLVGLALRRNPRRAHLLVSTVLGKHVPVGPAAVLHAGRALGEAVRAALDEGGADVGAGGDAVVLGYAETATALGHAVAAELGARYVHSTRRRPDGVDLAGALAFEEEHSHATAHLLVPEDPHLLEGDGPLVLVDDELSTGRTVLNTLASLVASAGSAPSARPSGPGRRRRCVVAALVDVRSPADRAAAEETARALGVRLDVVALATGGVEVPEGTPARVAALLAGHDGGLAGGRDAPRGGAAGTTRARPGDVVDLGSAGWPDGVREGGRHGFGPVDAVALDAAVRAVAASVLGHLATPAGGRPSLPAGTRVLVLGSEELMWAPQRIAAALADAVPPGVEVLTSSTTRSPVLVLDDPGYPLRTAVSFAGDDGGPRFAYNVAPGRDGSAFDEVVLVLDDGAGPGGAVGALAGACGRLAVITLPAHRPGGGRR